MKLLFERRSSTVLEGSEINYAILIFTERKDSQRTNVK